MWHVLVLKELLFALFQGLFNLSEPGFVDEDRQHLVAALTDLPLHLANRRVDPKLFEAALP
jgi:hypothetical protein